MVPEFAGGAPALSDPGSTNFRFDKFGLSVVKTFAPWLSAGAAIEVENHRDLHSHGFDPAFGCPGTGVCIERFGSEEAETEINLDGIKASAAVLASRRSPARGSSTSALAGSGGRSRTTTTPISVGSSTSISPGHR